MSAREKRPYCIQIVDPDGQVVEEIIDLNGPWMNYAPTISVVPNPNQPRKYFGPEKLERLTESLEGIEDQTLKSTESAERVFADQEQSVTVIPFTDPNRPEVKWMVNDGGRRHKAISNLGFRAILISYRPGVTEKNLFRSSFRSNWCREGHTYQENTHAVEMLREEGLTYAQISKIAGRASSPSWASAQHSLLRLHPKLLALMDPPTPKKKRLPYALALQLTQHSHAEQIRKLNETVGMSKSEAWHHIRTQSADLPNGQRRGRPRKPSDNREFFFGKLNKASRELGILTRLPVEFLEAFAGQDIKAFLELLQVAEESIPIIRSTLVAAAAKTPSPQEPPQNPIPATASPQNGAGNGIKKRQTSTPSIRIRADKPLGQGFTDADFTGDPEVSAFTRHLGG